MTTPTTAQRVIHCIEQQLGAGQQPIQPSDELAFNLNCDSLDLVEITMAIEAEFDIRIDDGQFVQLKTVQQVIDHVNELMGVTA